MSFPWLAWLEVRTLGSRLEADFSIKFRMVLEFRTPLLYCLTFSPELAAFIENSARDC